MKLYGGIEAGGTKIVCMVAAGPDQVAAQASFSTTTPDETIGKMVEFFQFQMQKHVLKGLGVGSFGPLDLNPRSSTYGYITTTPKAGWHNTDLVGKLSEALKLPVVLDTDVNAAAQGEYLWGNGIGMDPLAYYTIGTGIGLGLRVNQALLHGLTHPEGGHIILKRDPNRDSFNGCCPYHGDCFEGLASGPAIEKRWGQRAESLPPDHPAWDLEAYYLAQALCDTILMLSPQRIVLGGGVMQQTHLFPLIRQKVLEMLQGYVKSSTILSDMEHYIVPARLGSQAGVLGSVALAINALG
jgi:fructokinase